VRRHRSILKANVDAVLLNRTGIILGIAAGILLAPDLIGDKRLKAFEGWLERTLPPLHRFVRRVADALHPDRWAGILTVLLFPFWLVIFVAPAIGPSEVRGVADALRGPVLTIVGLSYIVYFAWLASRALASGLGRAETSMQQPGTVERGWMLVLGIVLFVAGGVLQLVATF
jgi:hypothetical protein